MINTLLNLPAQLVTAGLVTAKLVTAMLVTGFGIIKATNRIEARS